MAYPTTHRACGNCGYKHYRIGAKFCLVCGARKGLPWLRGGNGK